MSRARRIKLLSMNPFDLLSPKEKRAYAEKVREEMPAAAAAPMAPEELEDVETLATQLQRINKSLH